MERVSPVLDNVVIAALFVFVAFAMFSISVTQIAAGIGGIAWMWRTQLNRTWGEQNWPLRIPMGLYVAACLIAVADAYDVSYSFESLKKLFEILIFFWVINCVRNNKLRDSLVLLLIVSATLAGLLGFYQAWRDGVQHWTRVEGTMSIYMTFAGLLMMVGMVALGRIFFRRPIEHWLYFSVGIISICLLFTLTRQAWFGFLIGLVFLTYIWKKQFLLVLPVFIVVVFLASPPQAKERLRSMVSGNDYTFIMRTTLWKGGWEISKDHLLTGCGFRCVDLVHHQYPDPTGYVERLRGMHNNFMQLLVDTGILGLSAWLGIWFYFFRMLYKKAMALEGDTHERWALFGSAAAVIAFLSGGFFESNFYDSEVVMVLYFIMALPFAGSEQRRLYE